MQVHPENGRQDTHRHDHDDRQRQGEGLILSGQHQEDEHHRHDEDDGRAARRLLLLQGDFGPLVAEAIRQRLGRQLFHRGDGVAGGHARRRFTLQFRSREQVVADHARRAGIVGQGRHRTDRHHPARGRTDLQVGDVGQLVAIGGLGLGGHAEGAAQEVEVVDVGRAEVGAQGAEHGRGLDPHQQGLVAVDIGGDARRAGVVEAEHLLHLLRRLGGRAHHGEGRAFQSLEAGAGTVLDHHLEARAGAHALNRRGRQHEDAGFLDDAGRPAERAGQGRGFQFGRGPLIIVLQLDEHGGGVGRQREAGAVQAGEGGDFLNAIGLLDDLDSLGHGGFGAFQRGARRKLDDADQHALVLRRNEAGGRIGHAPARQRQQGGVDDEHDRDHADQAGGQTAVTVRHPVEAFVELGSGPAEVIHHRADQARLAVLVVILVRLEQQGRKGRGQGQRHQQRNQRRRGDGDGELAEEDAGDAGHEGGRHEHRGQHQGDGDQGARHFLHRPIGRFLGGQALADVTLDVLDHDDGVVDDDADGQNQGEQRQGVDRIAQGQLHREGADEGDRDGQDRDDGRAPGLQEDQDDDHHQEDGFDQHVLHGRNRGGDVFRRVIGDGVFHARREVGLDGVQFGDDRIGRRQGV